MKILVFFLILASAGITACNSKTDAQNIEKCAGCGCDLGGACGCTLEGGCKCVDGKCACVGCETPPAIDNK